MKVRRYAARVVTLAALAVPATAVAVSAQTGPAWAATHLSADVLTMACAPAVAYEQSSVPLRITGGQAAEVRVTATPGDLITINAGSKNGIEVGQQFFVRRVQEIYGTKVSRRTPGIIRTAGWIRVYAVDEDMSLATIVYGCDVIEVDDYLEPFTMPTVVPRAPKKGKPERDNYAKVLVGNDGHFAFAKGDFFTIDRGKDHNIVPGSQFVIYRNKRESGNFLSEIAEAMAVDVRDDTATLTVTRSRDAIQDGDYVSMRKEPDAK